MKTFDGDLRCKNFWIYGPTGTGKSRIAREFIPCNEIYDKAINKWWNGYDNQKYVIMDDYPSMEIGNCLVQHIKRWADRYPFTAEIKGAHSAISPSDYILIVTSNFKISECFKTQKMSKQYKEGLLKSTSMKKLQEDIIPLTN